MLRNVRKVPLAAVERSAARLGIVRSALEPVKSTDRLWLKWARTGPMHCSANQQIIDNSFGWRIEEIVRERQHQPRHNRAADHRWRLVSSSCQPGPQIFHPAGRVRGSRNALSEEVICALLRDFRKHGEKAIAKVRRDHPGIYLKVLALLIPRQDKLEHTNTIKTMTDEELVV